MKFLDVFFIVCFFLFAIFIYVKAFRIFCIIEGICHLILLPIDSLGKLFTSRDSILPGGKIIRLIIMVGAFIAAVVYTVVSLIGGTSFSSLVGDIVYDISILGFVNLFSNGFQPADVFSYTALLSLGLLSFLSFLYMRCTVDSLADWDLHPLVQYPLVLLFNVAFIFVSCLLSQHISAFCSNAAEFMLSVYHRLTAIVNAGADTALDFFKILFTGLLLLLLLYAALSLFTITFREVLATVMYGIFGLGLLIILGLFATVIWSGCPQWIIDIVGIVALLLPEYIRANEDAKEAFTDFILGVG